MASDILSALVRFNLTVSLAIGLVLILRMPLRRIAGARLAYALWLLVPLCALAGFVPAFPWAITRLQATAGPLPPGGSWVDAALIGGMRRSLDGSAVLSPAILAVWMTGAVLLFGLALLRHNRAMRDAAAGPAVVGILAPRVILPTDFSSRFDGREQVLVLAHEEIHRRGGHTRINAGVELLRCLNWVNPLVHLAARLTRVDQELACDACVIGRFPNDRRTYAAALLKAQVPTAHLPLGCHWPVRSSNVLKARILMLGREMPSRVRLVLGGALISTIASMSALAVWAAAPSTLNEAVLNLTASDEVGNPGGVTVYGKAGSTGAGSSRSRANSREAWPAGGVATAPERVTIEAGLTLLQSIQGGVQRRYKVGEVDRIAVDGLEVAVAALQAAKAAAARQEQP